MFNLSWRREVMHCMAVTEALVCLVVDASDIQTIQIYIKYHYHLSQSMHLLSYSFVPNGGSIEANSPDQVTSPLQVQYSPFLVLLPYFHLSRSCVL